MAEDEGDRRVNEAADRLYIFLGRYNLTFQWIEAQLDQILLLAYGEENWSKTQTKLAKMWNIQKINDVKSVVMAPSPFGRKNQRPGWTEDFADLIERLKQEGKRRNGIVHSQYLFDFVEAGMPPLMSNRRKTDGDAEFDQVFLESERTEAILKELAILAFDISQARVQLVHWYTPETL